MSMYVVNGRPVYSDTLSHARPQLTYKPAGSKAAYLAKTQNGRYFYTQEEIDALGREPQSVNADDGTKGFSVRGKSSIPGLKMKPKSVTSTSKVAALKRYEARSGRPAPRNLQRNSGDQDPFANKTPRNLQPNLADTTYKAPADEPKSFFQRVGDVAKNIWGRIRNIAVSAVDTAKRGFSAARSWVSRAVSDAGKFARTALSAIKTKAKAIKDSVEGYWAGITGNYDYSGRSNEFNRAQMTGRMNASQVRKLGENIGTAAQNVGNAASELWNDQVVPAAVATGDTVEGYARGITGNYDYSGQHSGPEFARAQMTGRMNASQLRKLGENFVDGAGNVFDAAGQFLGRVGAAVGNTAGQVGDAFNQAGQFIGNTAGQVGDAFNQAGQFIGNTAGQVGSEVRQAFNYQRMAGMPVVKEAINNGIPSESVNGVLQTLAATGNTSEQAVTSALNELASGTWDPNQAAQDAYVMNNYLQEQHLPEQILKEQYLPEQILKEQYR